MMPRIFVDTPLSIGETLEIGNEDGHHFARVLRARVDEELVVAASNGPFLTQIRSVDNKGGAIVVQAVEAFPSHESRCQVFVVQGLAKGDKMETIVQKGTEVGAAGFIVVEAARSVVKYGTKAEAKLERLQKVVKEAAGQSQRDEVPSVSHAGTLERALAKLQELSVQHVFLLDEDEDQRGIRSVLNGVSRSDERFAILVGPEGGWDANERELLKSVGVATVTLGPRILRTETAGLVGVSAILYHFGQLGG